MDAAHFSAPEAFTYLKGFPLQDKMGQDERNWGVKYSKKNEFSPTNLASNLAKNACL